METAREIAEWYAPSAAEELERMILRLVVRHIAAEREACATLAEQYAGEARENTEEEEAFAADQIATAIRNRK